MATKPPNDVAAVKQQQIIPEKSVAKIMTLNLPYLSAKNPGISRPNKLVALIIEIK